MAIGPARNSLGNASFLLLIVAFISPPSDPITTTIERQLFMITLIALNAAVASISSQCDSSARRDTLNVPQ
jgi:hypothetical protein